MAPAVLEAVDSRRHAAGEARTDLEGRLERSKAAYRAGIEAAREVAFSEDAPQEDEVEEELVEEEAEE